ncbi:helix-turn-helix domain-containing protein [Cytophaga hutchinsonii]|jgi:transcriptional regulator with XRE-family HTH domain|uniref:Transcriptional regulator, XRE family n=1 Tax=Cytophaga hutchinsonii (strain ATCC 33406 / DSM 1761 / CIP 103989 / NBRC 15051 / NCIMB 9469 / D465) TaxID=269798 RepID=A0A6N4SXK4_CYTH3|nr:helix-turn-helix transcriptional regulator [Cytophaga hutchinsonii]ABG61012.1 transcriptional regulator, XRE family [Cytophaga hutchinsonii ATCC 33406]SFX44334.1 Helix-turn-helix domain-containing protein [Cytophaga hutchinsonii ATCC 33406]
MSFIYIMSYISNINNWYVLSDTAIIEQLGKELKRMRLKNNLTQQELANRSGLFRSTISEIENGRVGSLLSLIQLLRALDKLELLDAFVIKEELSPLLVAEQQAKLRKRASNKRKPDKPESEW